MDYYTFFGMFVTAGITIVGVYFTVSKNQKSELEKTFEQRQEQIDAINKQTQETIKLNINMEHMNKTLSKQEERVTKHGAEIDKNRDRINDHETRIKTLESK
ncbi:hypothetical protein LJC02_01945 [Breznakia sp. OttesenSCG-928-G09]|nr:hypothetical protein [Breznakia sp. OttesenSCG-928-G09]